VLTLMVNAAGGAWSAVRSAARRRRPREPEMRLPAPRCLRCRGTGWLNSDPERTFTFTGDGFEDKHTPATMCPDCGGTGVAPQR
jgi:hypothetical protein